MSAPNVVAILPRAVKTFHYGRIYFSLGQSERLADTSAQRRTAPARLKTCRNMLFMAASCSVSIESNLWQESKKSFSPKVKLFLTKL